MIRSILVPLDGSPFAERALAPAVRIARRDGATVTFVRVVPPMIDLGMQGGAPVLDPTLDRTLRNEAETYLDGVRARAIADGVQAAAVLREGSVVEGLVDTANEANADLVIMTSHGRGGLSRAWLGSVADGVMRRAGVPVLMLRPGEDAPTGAGPVGRVLLPLDGSERGAAALEPAIALARADGARLTLLRIVVAEASLGAFAEVWRSNATSRQQKATVEAVLGAEAERLAKQTGLTVDAHVVAHENPALAILEFAAHHDCDLIAMATHGSGGVLKFLIGSVADKVVRGASTPVLLVRPSPESLGDGSPVAAANAALALGGVAPFPA